MNVHPYKVFAIVPEAYYSNGVSFPVNKSKISALLERMYKHYPRLLKKAKEANER